MLNFAVNNKIKRSLSQNNEIVPLIKLSEFFNRQFVQLARMESARFEVLKFLSYRTYT